jgi:hypothetical protein
MQLEISMSSTHPTTNKDLAVSSDDAQPAVVEELLTAARGLSSAGAVDLLNLARAWRRAEMAGQPYRPTSLGGLWAGVDITGTDIDQVRTDAWGDLASLNE